MKQLLTALLSLTLFISCSKDNDEVKDYTAQNEKEIIDYLTQNNLTAQRTNSGLYYIIIKEGESESGGENAGEEENAGENETDGHPTLDSNVTVIYKGYFTNGKVFDETTEGVSFVLRSLIPGWKEGIPFLKTGGEIQLFVPSHLGYGSKDYKSIPGGSVLIFDITLKSVN
ncbi:FKBP-type peptidyl-prolyl cis-trans isomerase [Flavobacterium sp. HSC-32F16]|uniref:FKBP-type peptidyl-prolyl cis-trans isomerase n=1 Tax=Flavobacterium sp. HSC-32F16 TaxID=2910964 RepID=UPI0020A34C63|nr:FKBP-type peptidyl-prolyl cis-trans isomerase [Flavobacterium sp. HSC-32F16]MCP2027629.1 FKBP-type peptidyl-prolyl cis-trans isomerase [Flavobacterium sp. HSC-32F16]